MPRALQVYVDDDEFKALEQWASERGWTLSQSVRAALRALTRATKDDEDPLLGASGMIEGLPSDLSERFDEYLAQTYVAGSPRGQEAKPKRRPRKPVR